MIIQDRAAPVTPSLAGYTLLCKQGRSLFRLPLSGLLCAMKFFFLQEFISQVLDSDNYGEVLYPVLWEKAW